MTQLPPLVWIDVEATSLDPIRRRAWDVAAIVRRPDGTDVEYQWFVHVADLDLPSAHSRALEVGRFWTRHPQAQHVQQGRALVAAPDRPNVCRLPVVLEQLAPLVAGGARVLGSAPWFDMDTLGPRMIERGVAPGWHYHPDDVPAMIKGFLASWVGLTDELAYARSDDLCRMIGVDPDEYPRHTAIGDCRLFRDAYDVILRGGNAFQERKLAAAGGGHAASHRCPNCDHLAAYHSEGGCWHTAPAGRAGANLVCPCPRNAEELQAQRVAAFRQEFLGTWRPVGA